MIGSGDNVDPSVLLGTILVSNGGNSKKITQIRGCAGSVLDYDGDAIVNAANEGCVSGFGVDGAINKACGYPMKAARQALGGCPTGKAKVTPSFEHTKVHYVIHAVGPVYRFPFGMTNSKDDAKELWLQSKDILLQSAYREAIHQASLLRQPNVTRIAFCLLSAGVFRGERSLQEIIEIGVRTLIEEVNTSSTCSIFSEIVIYGYTKEEQNILRTVLQKYKNRI